nr:RING-H2 finger protein ATL16-like [Ipomoea batatas]
MGHRSFSPMPSPPAGSIFTAPLHSHHAGFPIIAVAIIGILATGLLLVSYYVFVIKCCLNWHRIDLLRRFSFSRRRRVDEPFAVFSPPVENRGLDEAAIRTEDDDYVVIEISTHDRRNNNTNSNQSLVIHSGELSSTISITPSPRPKISRKKPKNFAYVSSFGDECIDIRHKDEQFAKIQPIRRSFSMDSAADRQLFLAVQEIVQQHSSIPEVNDLNESGSSSRIKRSFFSFGHGWGSRNAVQPIHLEP